MKLIESPRFGRGFFVFRPILGDSAETVITGYFEDGTEASLRATDMVTLRNRFEIEHQLLLTLFLSHENEHCQLVYNPENSWTESWDGWHL